MRNEGGKMRMELSGSQSYAESGIYFLHFDIRDSADVIGEQRFMNTDQIITVDSTVVFKTLIDTNFNLGGEAVIIRVCP